MDVRDTLFYLLYSYIAKSSPDVERLKGLSQEEWDMLFKVSKEQGVTALIFEKIQYLPAEVAPSKQLMLQWFSHTLTIENQMKQKYAVAVDFAERLNAVDIPVVVLKGFAVASYYPNPFYRECGDLDCYMMGLMEQGEAVAHSFGASTEEANYKHSHIHFKGLTIENHKYFTSFNNTTNGKHTEQVLRNLLFDEEPLFIGDTKLLKPNCNFNAFFLAKHALRHFIDEAISLRHIVDWALFLKAEGDNVDWERLLPYMDSSRILTFVKILNYVCAHKLGINLPKYVDVDSSSAGESIPLWAEGVLDDTFGGHPSIAGETFPMKCKRILRRFRRILQFRFLADESPVTLIWNTFAFSSYLHRNL